MARLICWIIGHGTRMFMVDQDSTGYRVVYFCDRCGKVLP